MDFSFTVIIVTYNRIELLKECMEHVLNQTLAPKSVVLIDNASTDGTKEYLDSLNTDKFSLRVVHMENNTGGAGGFYQGLVEAMRTDSDWFMLIDDDAILEYDCLEKMSYVMSCNNAKAYACTVRSFGKIDTSHRRIAVGAVPEREYQKDAFSCIYATFCGLVVARNLVEKIGYPIKEYFIWFDDTEYSMRIQKHTEIIVCTQAELNHKITPVHSGENQHHTATWKNYYGTRNSIDSLRRHKMWKKLLKEIKRISGIILRFFKYTLQGDNCLIEAQIFWTGLKDGLRGKLGINPEYLPGKKLRMKD